MTFLAAQPWQSRAIEQEVALAPTDPAAREPGFFDGSLGAVGSGIGRAGATANYGAGVGLYEFGRAFSQPIDALFDTDTTGFLAENLTDAPRSLVAQMTPDPMSTGTLGRILHSIIGVGLPVAAGALTAGPAGAIGAGGLSQGLGTFADLTRAGVDGSTATGASVIDGLLAAAGVALPGAIGSNVLRNSLIYGPGANIAQDFVAGQSVSEVLERNGYAQQASRYGSLDRETLIADALLGAAFGYGGARMNRPPSALIDDALAARDARNLEVESGAIPNTGEARRAHLDSLQRAQEQLLAGEAVTAEVPTNSFVKREPVIGDDAVTEAFRDSGYPELAREIEALEAQVQARGLPLVDEKLPDAPHFPTPKDPLDAPNFGLPEVPRAIPDGDPLLTDTSTIATPEREALRSQIVTDTLAGTEAVVGRKPIAVLMGGGGASGKGTLLARLKNAGLVRSEGAVQIDPDAIKGKIPEYGEIQKRGDGRAAAVVHEESSALAKRVLAEAMAGKRDIVLDRTLGDQAKGLAEIQALKDAGYEVHLHGVTVDPAKAVQRAVKRAQRTGRHVPTKALLTAHKGFAAAYEAYARAVDVSRLYDSDVAQGEMPREIAVRGPDGQVEIRDAARYNAFAKRAELNEQASTIRELLDSPDDGRIRPQAARVDARGLAASDQGPRGQRAPPAGADGVSGQRLSDDAGAALVERTAEAVAREKPGMVLPAAVLPDDYVGNMRRWFGDSKVVDERGEPLRVFHGTASDFESFSTEKVGSNTGHAGSSLGFFLTANPIIASGYADVAARGGWAGRNNGGAPSVVPVYVKIENPLKYESASAFYRDADANKGREAEWRAEIEAKGYDGIIVRDDFEEIIAFNPAQIKSAVGNSGKFSDSASLVDALDAADRAIARAETDALAYDAAVECFLRQGGST